MPFDITLRSPGTGFNISLEDEALFQLLFYVGVAWEPDGRYVGLRTPEQIYLGVQPGGPPTNYWGEGTITAGSDSGLLGFIDPIFGIAIGSITSSLLSSGYSVIAIFNNGSTAGIYFDGIVDPANYPTIIFDGVEYDLINYSVQGDYSLMETSPILTISDGITYGWALPQP